MSNATTVYCPQCKRTQPRQGPNAIYWCEHCRGQFDNDPDEGGTFNDPVKAAEVKEAREQRERSRSKNQFRRRF